MDLANRNELEAQMAKRLGKLQQGQYRQLLQALGNPPRVENLPPDYFQRMADELQGAMQPVMEDIYIKQAAALMGLDKVKALAVDWNLINERAAQWARQYAGELCRNISDTTKAAIKQQVEGFYRDARTMGDLEASLARLFGPVRAEMIAITEVTRAAAQGELGFAEQLRGLGLRTVHVWVTSMDDIVCPICGPLNEKEQGDGWSDPPPAHPRCILPGNEILIPGQLSAAAQSFYDGRCVEITLSDGRVLSVTENHPILTGSGWVAAQFLREGDYVISTLDAQRVASSVNPNNDNGPVIIEQVFSAFKEAQDVFARAMPATPVDFYGDGRNIHGNINVIYKNGFLGSSGKTSFHQPVIKGEFNRNGVLEASFVGDSLSNLILDGMGNTTNRSVGVIQHGSTGVFVSVLPTDDHAIRDIARGDITFQQAVAKSPAIDASLARQFLLRFASEITGNQIVKVRYFEFSGHVFDLQVDEYELYICNGVIVKNCRCWLNTKVIPNG